MRKTIPLLALLFFFHPAFSQQDSLLKNFKFRVDKYRAIGLFTGTNNNYSNLNYSSDRTRNRNSSTVIDGNYTQLKSTDKIYRTIFTSLSSNLTFGRSKRPSENYKSSTINIAPAINISNTWFGRLLFVELGTQLSAQAGKYKSYNKGLSTEDRNYTNHSYFTAASAAIGTGRLENVTDMQNALWLYKALLEEDKLSRSLTDAELNELGRTITAANNTRILDARKRVRFMLETVDRFFQQKGVVKNNDIQYFSGLNDILFFAINNRRLSGVQKFISVNPGFRKQNIKDANAVFASKSENNRENKYLRSEAGIRIYRPVNLKHQNNYFINALYDYFGGVEKEREFTNGIMISNTESLSRVEKAGIRLAYEHAIYPNTRTSIVLGIDSESGLQKFSVQDPKFYSNITAEGTMNYFISYRTMLTGKLWTGYQKNIYYPDQFLSSTPDGFTVGFNLGLSINL